MQNIAIIPARGGSKRIPGKNIKPFAGRPMLSYPIQAALESGLFERVIVSTDSDEVTMIARKYGAEVPFVRPADLSDDFATTAQVVAHALAWLEKNGSRPQNAACIYPATPFLTSNRIRAAHRLLTDKTASAVVTVRPYPHSIYRALKLGPGGELQMLWPEHELTRTNDLPAAYHDAAQLYWLNVDTFKKTGKIWAPGALPLVLSAFEAIDIDTPEDWKFAELIHRGAHAKES